MCTVMFSDVLFGDVTTIVLLYFFFMCCAGDGKREGRLEWHGEGVRRSSWAIVERDDFIKEKCFK